MAQTYGPPLDELDRQCLRFALDRCQEGGCAIDLGCGFGAQSLRLGAIGIAVTMIDIIDIYNIVTLMNHVIGSERLRFLNKNAIEVTASDLPPNIDIFYSQRFLHYLKYDDAIKVLGTVSERLNPAPASTSRHPDYTANSVVDTPTKSFQ